MTGDDERPLSVAEALQAWREAERRSVRSTAQREAADEALEAAGLAQRAARATADAAAAAVEAAGEAARAAEATANAADKVVAASTQVGAERRRIEQEAVEATEAAREQHKAALQRVDERHERDRGA